MHRSVPLDRLIGITGQHDGLTESQVQERLSQYGRNDIQLDRAATWRDVLRDTLRDPMPWFLLATAVLFFVLGDTAEAVTLLVAVVPLVAMDIYLHQRTRASTEGLISRLATYAYVQRRGEQIKVPAAELVPGDLVLIRAGDYLPADGVLLGSSAIQVDESALTGESFPVSKSGVASLAPQHGSLDLPEGRWAYAGTRVLAGTGRLRVLYTGAETVYGEIVRSVVESSHSRTPLQQAISRLVAVLVVSAVALCLLLATIRLLQGFGMVDAVLSAVTLAVAALPEEFPVVFTFFLGVGVYRLAKRRALVRRAVVVESIGRVTCVCSDKTGTMTEGRLHLSHSYPAPGHDQGELLSVAASASAADTADPMDEAILSQATSGGGELLATFPFTEDRRRSTLAWRRGKQVYVPTKGAPEVVLGMCRLEAATRSEWMDHVEALAGSGHKVIACAQATMAAEDWSGQESGQVFELVGLLAFEDPVREGVADAVRSCRDAGIRVIMVTGDHPAAAHAVACELGLGAGEPIVTHADLAPGLLPSVDVIARAVPSQKLELVRLLRESGETVLVTGDGVNDVPALQAADIGVAMGDRGTRSAREAAAIVLLDDNFRTIVSAIAEGRQLFRNLKLSFAYLLMIHLPLVLTAALIPLLGYPLLYLPIHIVWLELIIHPTAMLVFQGLPAPARLSHTTSTSGARFFSRRDWCSVSAVGALLTMFILGGYAQSVSEPDGVLHARAMVLVMLTAASAMLTVVMTGLRTTTSRVVAGLTFACSLLLVQNPVTARLLDLQPLHTDNLLLAIAAAAGVAGVAWMFRLR